MRLFFRCESLLHEAVECIFIAHSLITRRYVKMVVPISAASCCRKRCSHFHLQTHICFLVHDVVQKEHCVSASVLLLGAISWYVFLVTRSSLHYTPHFICSNPCPTIYIASLMCLLLCRCFTVFESGYWYGLPMCSATEYSFDTH